jgi:hypothetical protein
MLRDRPWARHLGRRRGAGGPENIMNPGPDLTVAGNGQSGSPRWCSLVSSLPPIDPDSHSFLLATFVDLLSLYSRRFCASRDLTAIVWVHPRQ